MIDSKVDRSNGNFRMLFSPKFSKNNFLNIDKKNIKILYCETMEDVIKKCIINYHASNFEIIKLEFNTGKASIVPPKFLKENIKSLDVVKVNPLNDSNVNQIIKIIEQDLCKIGNYTIPSVKYCRNNNFIVFYTNCKLCTRNGNHMHRNNRRYYLFNVDEKKLSIRYHCGDGNILNMVLFNIYILIIICNIKNFLLQDNINLEKPVEIKTTGAGFLTQELKNIEDDILIFFSEFVED